MAVRSWRLLSLCDGYGGTELALRSVARISTVARVERDAYAASVLVARMEEARLDLAPVWDDVSTFDGGAWRGRVDIVAAGFPCQPFSTAGAGGGVDDDRWLWPAISRVIRDVVPGWILLENVGGVVRNGLPEILHDLARLGFDAEWGLYSAADVGAPHLRKRFWLVAHANDDPRSEWRLEQSGRADAAYAGEDVAYAAGVRRGRARFGSAAQECAGGFADIHGGGAWPPGPDDVDGWDRWVAEGGPQPVVRRSSDGAPLGLADALHLGGNGLVPQCAAEAWGQLIRRAGG